MKANPRAPSWRIIRGLIGVFALAALPVCSSGSKGNSSGTNTLDTGVCVDECIKPCEKDEDCDISRGQLCCDYGQDGKACSDAKECPRQCMADTKCDTAGGEACLRVTLDSASMVCAATSDGIHLCQSDTDCKETGEVCCGAYKEPVCVKADRCPKSCAGSTDCNTQVGEVCCTSLPSVDKTLKGAICIVPKLVACPVACMQSSDCNNKLGELCCNGLCSTSCQQTCTTSSDCRAQICCKTKAASSALARKPRRPGYTVVTTGGQAGGTDICATNGYYGDGTCDRFCPSADPDCAGTGGGAGTGGAAGGSGSGGYAGAGGFTGTGGASGSGGRGGSGGGVGVTAGGKCTSAANCGAGLECVQATGSLGYTESAGPPNGLCTRPCTTGAECNAVTEICLTFEATGASPAKNWCLERCTVGDGNGSKCHGRSDMACASVSSADAVCLPTCSVEADCAGRKCEFRTGLCVDALPTGDPIGASCDSLHDTCRAFCLPFAAAAPGALTNPGVCSGSCRYGQVAGCGYTAAPIVPGGGSVGGCLLAAENSGALGDLGDCVQLCDTLTDCKLSPSTCDSTLASTWGHGYCWPDLGAGGAL